MGTSTYPSRDSASSSHRHRLLQLLDMALWFMRLRTFLRMVLALLSLVGPLVGFAATYVMLRDWIHVRQGELYYVEHNYLGDAALWGLLSLGTVLAAARVLFVREAGLRWLWLPMAMCFVIIFVPTQAQQHHPAISGLDGLYRAWRVQNSVRFQLLSVRSDLQTAIERGHTLPCVSGPTSIVSRYFQGGVHLTYQRICLTTNLPFESLLTSSAPGTLFVVTRPGDPTIRLRATVLERNVDATSKWLQPLFGTGPMELIISPQSTPSSSPPVHQAAASMSSTSAPNTLLPSPLPHANH